MHTTPRRKAVSGLPSCRVAPEYYTAWPRSMMNQAQKAVMETDQLLQEIVERIRSAGQPERIILFGSRARGQAHPHSDYDLLVIQESEQPRYRRAAPLYAALADLPAEVDVMVYTPGEVHEWSAVPQAFVTTAVGQGKLLYERKG